MNRVLVISPHPDDDVIGMGGTIARMVSQGTRVSVLYVAPGARATRTFEISDGGMAELRESEAAKAAGLLGVSAFRFLRLEYPGEAEARPQWDRAVRNAIAHTIDAVAPREIYAPHPEESHRTHAAAAMAVLSVLREKARPGLTAYGYEIWTPIQKPDRFEDVTPFEDLKRRGIRAHESQVRDKAYEDGIMGLNRYRAVFYSPNKPDNCRYMEAFTTLHP